MLRMMKKVLQFVFGSEDFFGKGTIVDIVLISKNK